MNSIARTLALALALSACGAEEAPATPTADAPPRVAEVAEPAEAPAEDPAETEAEAPAEAEATAEAEPAAEGEDTCVAAFDEVQAFVAQLQERLGPGNGSGGPDRAGFLAGCRELPANVQSCMRMSYAMEHQAECRAAREGLDPETRARVQRLMGR